LSLSEALSACGFLAGERFALASILDGQLRGVVLDDPERGQAWADSQGGRNVYLTGNPVRPDFYGSRPKAADILERRVLLVDLDPIGSEDVAPVAQALWERIGGTLVDSGRGRQIWLRVPGDADCAGILRAIRQDLTVKVDCTYDASRLMRLPGTVNLKTGRLAAILGSRPSVPPAPLARPAPRPGADVPAREEVASLLAAIPPDCTYDEWLRVGMALHACGESQEVWESWSRGGAKYQDGDCERWCGFKADGGVGLGTLRHLAAQNGWEPEEALRANPSNGDLWDWCEATGRLETVAKAVGVSKTEAAKRAKRARVREKLSALPEDRIRYTADDCQWWHRHRLHGWQKIARSELNDLLGEGAAEQRRALFERAWIQVAEPFEPEDLDGRRWNREGAKLIEAAPGEWPTIRMAIDHVGQGLGDPMYLYHWAGFLVQNPKGKLPVLFLYSAENTTGKSSFHFILRTLFERGAVDGAGVLRGDDGSRFNSELAGAVLVYFDEEKCKQGGIDKLKKIVTEDVLLWEGKGKDRKEVPNRCHIVVTSNHADTLPFDDQDKRVVMWEVRPPDEPMEKEAFQAAVRAEAPAFLHYLLTLPLPEPEGRLQLPVLETDVKVEVARVSVDPVARFVKSNPDWVKMPLTELSRQIGLEPAAIEPKLPVGQRALWRLVSAAPIEGTSAEVSQTLGLGLSPVSTGRLIHRAARAGLVEIVKTGTRGGSDIWKIFQPPGA